MSIIFMISISDEMPPTPSSLITVLSVMWVNLASLKLPLNGDPTKIKVAYANSYNSSSVSTPYYSHPAWNFDGSLVSYGGEQLLGDNVWGTFIRNQDQNITVSSIAPSTEETGHQGWDGYDPNYVALDGYLDATHTTYGLQEANPNGTNYKVLVTYPARNASNTSTILIGPAQSPDSTKILFSIPDDFSNPSANTASYVAVSHRPLPPIVSVTSTSPVSLSWSIAVTGREVKGYHVYRSDSGTTGWSEISPALVQTTSYVDNSATSGQVKYYAVTVEKVFWFRE